MILAKSNMHELAAGITTVSSIGGQTCNPYDPDRAPGGSSGGSGAAVAASYAAVAFGSDTCGSIRIPSAVHNLFGLRPTKGLSSITGIVPLSHTQDVGGPIARSVTDLAIVLDATVGADPADTATRILGGRQPASFVAALDSTSLRGARLGVLTEHFGTEADDQEGTRIVRAALASMKARGAEVIDIAIPGLDSVINRAGVIDYELKFDLMDYLASIPNAPVKSLAEILDRGLYDVALDPQLRRRERTGARDSDAYRSALAQRTVARDMVVAFLETNKLDALVYPTVRRKAALINEPQRGANCQLSAVTGLPALSMPAGFTPDGLPIGVELLGRPLADTRLLSLAYDYEQSVHPRRAPSTTPPLGRRACPAAGRNDRQRSRGKPFGAWRLRVRPDETVARLCGSGERNARRPQFSRSAWIGIVRGTKDRCSDTCLEPGSRRPKDGSRWANQSARTCSLATCRSWSTRPTGRPGSIKGAIIAAPRP